MVGLAIAVGAVYQLRRHFFRKCPMCSGRLRLDSVKDPLGMNITKTAIFTIFKGPRRCTETWKCQACGHEVLERRLEWG